MSTTTESPPSESDSISRVAKVGHHLEVLDGWRAISILLVLASHMLPLGPARFGLNTAAGPAGMALFFTLSGFLITTTLYRHPSLPSFALRRFFRIEPLAFSAVILYLLILRKETNYYWPYFFYYVNYAQTFMTPQTGHFWSLCVEVHFYLGVALIVGLLGRRGLGLLPFLALIVTGLRVQAGDPFSLKTHLRVDEILAGSTLALIWMDAAGSVGLRSRRILSAIPWPVWAVGYLATAYPWSGWICYLRPYFAASLIGSTLLRPTRINAILGSRPARYLAEISYALYVVHPITMHGWLGTGGMVTKYLVKRPICIVLSIGMAHLSTFYFERHFTAMGKHLSRRWR